MTFAQMLAVGLLSAACSTVIWIVTPPKAPRASTSLPLARGAFHTLGSRLACTGGHAT